MKILILGGYGVFGGRLVRLLSDCPDLTMLIAGRNSSKAEAFCNQMSGAAKFVPLALDRANIADALARQRPELVVDASGPFQSYGAERYRVIEACIDAKVDYLDFADGADFVFGIDRYDDAARAAGIFALSGVSSFPVLTAAVLREFAKDVEVRHVEGGIAPSPFAGVGLNVMRAVVGYAGAPVKLLRDGEMAHGVGLGESRRYTIAVPGRVPLRNLRFSLVDVPDLQVIPPVFPGLQSIWMGAGPVPEILHRALNLLARARYRFRLPSLVPVAPLFYRVLNALKFGEHRGGMYVKVDGERDGMPVARSWHLLAEGDDGPYIPSMAIEAIVRKLLRGERPMPGARAATATLELSDYAELFAGRDIHMGFREDEFDAPLYRCILGDAFENLPPEVRALHDSKARRTWRGEAKVTPGTSLLAKIARRLIGAPSHTGEVPVSVTFDPTAQGEKWTRDFGGQAFRSHQLEGKGRDARLLVERFGPVAVSLALVVEGEKLHLVPRRWSIFGCPMPRSLLPKGGSYEAERDGLFVLDVEIAVPVIGRIVAYRGTLSPA